MENAAASAREAGAPYAPAVFAKRREGQSSVLDRFRIYFLKKRLSNSDPGRNGALYEIACQIGACQGLQFCHMFSHTGGRAGFRGPRPRPWTPLPGRLPRKTRDKIANTDTRRFHTRLRIVLRFNLNR